MKKILILLVLIFPSVFYAQLDFCKGSKGDPIFHEDFGPGPNTGPPLPAATTNYTFVSGDPEDGQYTISGRVGQDNTTWHNSFPPTSVSGGRALIVNADFESGLFYTTPITGLCENSSYEFSAYLMNVYNASSGACNNGGIPINVRFEIWDQSNTNLLKSGSTGNISSTSYPLWQQYALTFQSGAGQGSVILKMFDNGGGGCGNDLAIDDIIFRSCGDLTIITAGDEGQSSYIACESSGPEELVLTAEPDYSIYNNHYFQWQESDDNTTWTNINGETNEEYVIPEINASKFFRVKVAEDEINLNNNLCSSASEIFAVKYIKTPLAPISAGDVTSCSNAEIPRLQVTAGQEETVNWYDAPVGGNLLAEGTSFYQPLAPGTFYAEAINISGCPAGIRTSVTYTTYPVPLVEDEFLEICEDETLQLNAGVPDVTYQWSTGETARTIVVNMADTYMVKITTDQGCSVEKYFQVNAVVRPEILEILSEENSITILTVNPGNFEYSIDGINYQQSGNFTDVAGGIYFAFVRDLMGCDTVSLIFPHIVIPKYFSPNNDGYNDLFELKGAEYFQSSFINVFDRYGKLIKSGDGENFSWDGTFNGIALPEDDYWYEIFIEDFKEIKGHISLIR
jgi:gliding motility-associated-like protein